MKVSLIQADLFWDSPKKNLERIENILKKVPETDLIVLPETFTTGFSMNTAIWGDSENQMVVDWMKKMAREKQAALAGSTIFVENGKYYNRFLFMDETAAIQKYDKRHLFKPGTENKFMEKGKDRVIIHYKNWKIFPQICYDLRFPVWSRNDLDYDLMLNVANWPAQRDLHWNALLRARAIENQVYVVGVNRTGNDEKGIEYLGNSSVYAFDGQQLVNLSKDKATTTLELDKELMMQYRSKLNFLADRDRFEIL